MRNKFWMILGFATIWVSFSGCVQLAIGAAGAVIADEVIENRTGDDGLF
ncbi:hypothetical protein ACFFUT_12945 [Pseudohalocynthiibacter aestuariivivens]|jgi:hypothetical protein|uniref:Lipoprotein n=1 Tax=Pseudohalocynthiibacter aestuariivivens TaxID=1591409 RepID=A0ABV5JIK7_9RHOB|nr:MULTISPECIES: hypothetical protein [Pseudohalocynthiibacter]MBS9718177.1 hypothetical protein [Pseudohalocynthiibacter aestuariivivens]MCK0103827.1 hypothetical protein [Pseudohalocynthiibacter sp. F2068]